MKKNLFLLIISVIFYAELFSQENDIELQNVVTVIEGESIKVEDDSLPDFDDVLEVYESDEEILPQMPEVQVDENQKAAVVVENGQKKSVYAEGQLGGGYPSLFTGDFSVYRLEGKNPFRLDFHHRSMSGYSGNSFTEGYNDRNTSIAFEKKLESEKTDFAFGGLYETSETGLQNKVDNISNYDNDLIKGYGLFEWKSSETFSLSTRIDSSYYNRYADITYSSGTVYPDTIKDSLTCDVLPSIYGNWHNKYFNVDFGGNYWMVLFPHTDPNVLHRGDFGFGISWKNPLVKLFGNVDIIFGSNVLGEPVVTPFKAGVETNLPVYFSNRKVGLKLEGGLDSYKNEISSLERTYKYTVFTNLPNETSEWFGKFDFSLPLKTSFTGKMSVDLRKTAFDNGRYVPQYTSESLNNGLYGYACQNVTMFTTDFSITYHYKLLSLTGGWHSNWIDVPVMESSQMILMNVSLQDEESKWGVSVLSKVLFGDNLPMPIINLESFVRLTPAVRVVLNADDVIKLVTGEERMYGGQYIGQGGNVSIHVKFFF